MGQRRSTEGEAELGLLGPDPMVVSLVVCRAVRVTTAEASLHPAGGEERRSGVGCSMGRRRWLLQGGRRRGWEGRGMYGAEGACPGGGGPHSGLGPGGGPPGLPHTGGRRGGVSVARPASPGNGLHGSTMGWTARRGKLGRSLWREGWPVGRWQGEAAEKGSSALRAGPRGDRVVGGAVRVGGTADWPEGRGRRLPTGMKVGVVEG